MTIIIISMITSFVIITIIIVLSFLIINGIRNEKCS